MWWIVVLATAATLITRCVWQLPASPASTAEEQRLLDRIAITGYTRTAVYRITDNYGPILGSYFIGSPPMTDPLHMIVTPDFRLVNGDQPDMTTNENGVLVVARTIEKPDDCGGFVILSQSACE